VKNVQERKFYNKPDRNNPEKVAEAKNAGGGDNAAKKCGEGGRNAGTVKV